MVASRDIDPLEIILKEHPAVVGPYTNTLQGCLQCFRKVDGSYKCTGCGFPMCNAKCERGYLHREECQFFQEQHWTAKPLPLSPKPSTTSPTKKPFSPKHQLFSSKRIPKEASALAAAFLQNEKDEQALNKDSCKEEDDLIADR